MTYYEIIKQRLSKGYYILREYYPKQKVSIYQVVKDEDEKTRSVYCEIAYDVVRLLKKELGITVKTNGDSVALNFTPEAVRKGCLRTFIDEQEAVI